MTGGTGAKDAPPAFTEEELAWIGARPAPGLVHRSDDDAQYTTRAFGRQAGVAPSMARSVTALSGRHSIDRVLHYSSSQALQ